MRGEGRAKRTSHTVTGRSMQKGLETRRGGGAREQTAGSEGEQEGRKREEKGEGGRRRGNRRRGKRMQQGERSIPS